MDKLIKSSDVYALYAIPEDDYSTILAISLNKESLQDILENQVTEEDKKILKFEIKSFPIFLITKLINPNEKVQKMFGCFGTNKDLSMMPITSVKFITFTNKMFGFNKKLSNGDYIESVLLIAHDSAHDSDEYKEHLKYIREDAIFKNNVSENPINFDIYYDEGMMNA
jgi:hypothetical protein